MEYCVHRHLRYAYTLQESLSKDDACRTPTSGLSGKKQSKCSAVKLNSPKSSPHLAGLKPITTWFKHTTSVVMMSQDTTCSECSGGGEHKNSGNCNCCCSYLTVDLQDTATGSDHVATRQSSYTPSDGSSKEHTSILTGLCATWDMTRCLSTITPQQPSLEFWFVFL